MEMDKVTLTRINQIHPKLRIELRIVYDEICRRLTGRAVCRFSQVLRTFPEQDELYAQGRTKPGKRVTNARAGQSYHNYGLAVDFVLVIDGREASWDMLKDFDGDHVADWSEVVNVFKSHGWAWGGDWHSLKDYPHFEKTFGHSVGSLMQLYLAGRKDAGGYVLI